jgi:hypothetical protein
MTVGLAPSTEVGGASLMQRLLPQACTGVKNRLPRPKTPVGAEQRLAADCLQPSLLRRSGFRQQLKPSVRGAADKVAHLMGCKSPYRPLPDADGEHIRGMGR